MSIAFTDTENATESHAKAISKAIVNATSNTDSPAIAYSKTLGHSAVSYTHLTLPTSDLVKISVVAVSLKKKKWGGV